MTHCTLCSRPGDVRFFDTTRGEWRHGMRGGGTAKCANPSKERIIWPSGHTVHMSIDHSDREKSISVAHCDCGRENRTPWPGHHAQQDEAIEQHWLAVETKSHA